MLFRSSPLLLAVALIAAAATVTALASSRHARNRHWASLIAVTAAAALVAVGHGEELTLFLWVWFLHAVSGAVLSAPVVYFGRKRVHWGPLDLLAFVLPFAVWDVSVHVSSAGKSLSNIVEPIFFSWAIPIAALVGVIIGARARERVWSIGLVAVLCFVAAGVYWWTPALPE